MPDSDGMEFAPRGRFSPDVRDEAHHPTAGAHDALHVIFESGLAEIICYPLEWEGTAGLDITGVGHGLDEAVDMRFANGRPCSISLLSSCGCSSPRTPLLCDPAVNPIRPPTVFVARQAPKGD